MGQKTSVAGTLAKASKTPIFSARIEDNTPDSAYSLAPLLPCEESCIVKKTAPLIIAACCSNNLGSAELVELQTSLDRSGDKGGDRAIRDSGKGKPL